MEIKELLKTTKKFNLLFVEDDEIARKEISIVLNKFFNTVILANDGLDGLEKFRNNKIDLIIADINMPKMNGLDMLKEIKKENPKIYSIILSAHNETNYFIDAIKIGVNGFLLKPFMLEQFIETLTNIYKTIKLKHDLDETQYLLSQYQQIVDKAFCVCKFDTNKKITYVNKHFCNKFKYTDLINKQLEIFLYKEDISYLYSQINNNLWEGIIKTISKDKKIFYSKVIIKPLLNSNKEIVEYIMLFIDIGDILEKKQMLLDYVDYTKNPLIAILYITDCQNLRTYFGEKTGREINLKVGKILKSFLPKEIENIYNIGNGKFALVTNLDKYEKNQILNILETYQQQINQINVIVNDFTYNISIIMSISEGENSIEDGYVGIRNLLKINESFIDATKLAIKEKEKAKNNLKILQLIRNSINNKTLTCHYQDIIDNITQKTVKYEALVRIETEEKIYYPNEFLEIAKYSSYYSEITKFIIKHNLEIAKKHNINISVNISINDINKEIIRNSIYKILDQYQDYTHLLTFEILEDDKVDNIEILQKFAKKIKQYNIQIALDDFGSGYANFVRILNLQPDILKIDGSLIKNIANDNSSYNLVKSIADFAKLNNIKTIAEFVENENIFNIVKSLGIELSQGYYFAKPTKKFL